MGFGIDLRAHGRKKGLFRRGSDPRDLAARFGRLAPRMLDRWDRKTSQMHPAAPPVAVSLDGADLVVKGETWQVGPGYHAYVLQKIAALAEELDLELEVPALPELQRQMCEWLAGELRGGRTSFVERDYIVDGAAVLTMLGPRDAAWRDAVLADPMQARDAFAWWDKGDAARSRALLAMWHEVPWREPFDDAEREVLERFHRDAETAGLALPDSPVGYRVHDLVLELSGGWRVRVPGSFVGRWEDDGARYWATDGDRAIEFQSMTAKGSESSEQLLASAPERHDVIARLAEGTRCGRAEAFTDDDVRVVVGIVVDAPHIALLTCKGGDDAWALATWRSLVTG
ncbi:MAG TPA: hypothetical protein VLT45_18035 [Kofleriaceae bacterium]|nr:hypothetical protein [Kofleriaceae bacterium]